MATCMHASYMQMRHTQKWHLGLRGGRERDREGRSCKSDNSPCNQTVVVLSPRHRFRLHPHRQASDNHPATLALKVVDPEPYSHAKYPEHHKQPKTPKPSTPNEDPKHCILHQPQTLNPEPHLEPCSTGGVTFDQAWHHRKPEPARV